MSELCPVAVREVSSAVEDQPQTWQEANALLLKEKEYCDVTFTFPNLLDRIEAHEIFLKARSPVFKQLFRMRKSGNVQGKEIEISESTPERFQEFLEFIYMDKFEVNAAGALDLLHLAHKYKVQPLVTKCEKLLKARFKVKESVQVFETARRYGRDELVDRAGEIIVKSLAYLIQINALEDSEEETLIYLLKRDDLPVEEVDLFDCILKWGKHQVPSGSVVPHLLQDKLKNVIPLIRYTNMTPYEFTSVVLPTRLLSAEEIISVYSYLTGDNAIRKSMHMKFNITQRNMETFFDFYHDWNKEATSRSEFSSYHPLKLCMSFHAKTWGDPRPRLASKKPAITGIKVKWPSRRVTQCSNTETTLNFSVFIKEGPVKENARLRFQKDLLNCKDGEEEEITVEPAVKLVSGVMYCVIVEDESQQDVYPYHYTYSGVFSPYGGISGANQYLGGVHIMLNGIQKDSRLPGFQDSTASSAINVIRGIRVALV